MGDLHPNFIVGIGGSSGGLNAYIAFLDALPSNTGMAFVVVSHMLPTAHSQLASILSKHTKMPVMVVSMAMPIQANHVYVLPPNADLRIEGYTFKVVSPRTKERAGRCIFDFFSGGYGGACDRHYPLRVLWRRYGGMQANQGKGRNNLCSGHVRRSQTGCLYPVRRLQAVSISFWRPTKCQMKLQRLVRAFIDKEA